MHVGSRTRSVVTNAGPPRPRLRRHPAQAGWASPALLPCARAHVTQAPGAVVTSVPGAPACRVLSGLLTKVLRVLLIQALKKPELIY